MKYIADNVIVEIISACTVILRTTKPKHPIKTKKMKTRMENCCITQSIAMHSTPLKDRFGTRASRFKVIHSQSPKIICL